MIHISSDRSERGQITGKMESITVQERDSTGVREPVSFASPRKSHYGQDLASTPVMDRISQLATPKRTNTPSRKSLGPIESICAPRETIFSAIQVLADREAATDHVEEEYAMPVVEKGLIPNECK